MRTFNRKLNAVDRTPSFSVHKNSSNQTNITAIEKITWSTKEFDTNDNFASSAFTPTIKGKYLLSATVSWSAIVANDNLEIYIHKNGSIYKRDAMVASGVTGAQAITAVVDANGSTDSFEIYAQNFARNTSTVLGASSQSFFTGCKID